MPDWCKLCLIGTNCTQLVQIAPTCCKLHQPTAIFFKISNKWLWHFCLTKYYIHRYNSPCAIFLRWFPIGFVVNCGTGSGPNSGFVGYCPRVAGLYLPFLHLLFCIGHGQFLTITMPDNHSPSQKCPSSNQQLPVVTSKKPRKADRMIDTKKYCSI